MLMQTLWASIEIRLRSLRYDRREAAVTPALSALEAPATIIKQLPSQNQHPPHELSLDKPQAASANISSTDADWCNSYTPSPTPILPPDQLYGPTPYDINFAFPYLPHSLESRQLKLVPFIPRQHAQRLFEHASSSPEDYAYMRMPVPASLDELLSYFELHIRRDPSKIAFAVLARADEHAEWDYAAVLCLSACDPERLSAEITTGICFHPYLHTNGAIIAAAVLARYCVNAPTASPPGLGLRRLGWISHTENIPSTMIARGIGFKIESVRRWHRMAPDGKASNGLELREGDPSGEPGVDVHYLVMCWDDWEAEGSKLVEQCLLKRLFKVPKMKSHTLSSTKPVLEPVLVPTY